MSKGATFHFEEIQEFHHSWLSSATEAGSPLILKSRSIALTSPEVELGLLGSFATYSAIFFMHCKVKRGTADRQATAAHLQGALVAKHGSADDQPRAPTRCSSSTPKRSLKCKPCKWEKSFRIEVRIVL